MLHSAPRNFCQSNFPQIISYDWWWLHVIFHTKTAKENFYNRSTITITSTMTIIFHFLSKWYKTQPFYTSWDVERGYLLFIKRYVTYITCKLNHDRLWITLFTLQRVRIHRCQTFSHAPRRYQKKKHLTHIHLGEKRQRPANRDEYSVFDRV